ncbi:MAG TPA: hypothetical protein VG028_17925 [Terriglobia bacterium]|nr:hypothetical protein [Terriglobia bacterium]
MSRNSFEGPMHTLRLCSPALKLFVCVALTALMMGIVAPPRAAAQIALTVDAGAGQKPISPYIYGLNFAKQTFAAEINLPLVRWSGNETSRYNGKLNATNHGSDWFYHNYISGHGLSGHNTSDTLLSSLWESDDIRLQSGQKPFAIGL